MSLVAGVSFAQTGTRATSLTTCVTTRAERLILADVRSHVGAIHVRAGQVQLEPVGAGVLAGRGERAPAFELLVAARARHDRRDQDAVQETPS